MISAHKTSRLVLCGYLVFNFIIVHIIFLLFYAFIITHIFVLSIPYFEKLIFTTKTKNRKGDALTVFLYALPSIFLTKKVYYKIITPSTLIHLCLRSAIFSDEAFTRIKLFIILCS